MTSRHGVRPLRLMVIAAVIALLSTLFAATAAHAGTGSITGRGAKPSGGALSGSTVDLYSIDTDDTIYFEKSVKTRSDGTYTFGSLDRGQYIVGFAYGSRTYAAEYWNNRARIENASAISVGSSRVSSINARLAIGGKVTGRVLAESPNSDVVPGVEVIAYRYDDGVWTYGKAAQTGSDGTFTVSGLSDGQWTLEFNPPFEGADADLAMEYWEDSRTLDESDTFLVKPGTTVGGKDALLAPGGSISGKVTGPDGEPVVDALVFGNPGPEGFGNIAFTDENGDYVMTGLSAGEHRLRFEDSFAFDGPFGDEGYASEWWDDRESFTTAESITVTAGATTTGKNAQLDLASTPLVNTTPPSITGTPRVGETLTADPGAWTPRISDSTFEYQWFAGGTAIEGADSKTFTPRSNEFGDPITVRITADRGRGPVTAMSAPTEPLATGVLTQTGPLSLAPAEPRVGDKLDVTFATYNDPGSNSAQFLADGVPFEYDATEGVPAAALGKKLSVRQVTTTVGYETETTTSAESAPVQLGEFDPPTTAQVMDRPIEGVPVGVELRNEVAGADYQYQWFLLGREIVGADQPTYTPKSSDVGHYLTVRLSMSKEGYNPAVSMGGLSFYAVAESRLPTPWAEIVGEPRVGQQLGYESGSWQAGVTLAYQWLADGVPIDSATDSTFTLTPSELGKKITLRITGSKPPYTPGSVTTAPTEPVTVPSSTPFGAPTNLESPSSTATSIDLTWTDVDDAAGYRIYYGIGSGTRTRVEVGDVTSRTLKGLKPNTAYTIDIAALRSDGTRSSYSPRITARTDQLSAPTDLEVTQVTPTSVTLTWTKQAGVPRYRLYHGIGSGTRTKVEVGDVGTTTITGLKPNTTYSVDIASLLTDGTRSPYSPRIAATTDPFLPPTNLASPGATSSTIDLTWTKAPGATSYRIGYGIGGGTRTAVTIGNDESRTLTGLQPGTTYTIDMAAILPDGTKSPYSPRITVTTD